MALNVALPELKHKWIKIYDTEEQRLNEEENWQDNYEECCVSVDRNSLAGDNNKEEYQYSVRTTNNDNEKKGTYYNIEIPHYWAGLEIIWGYFGWEYIDYEYNGQKLKGGNLFKKIECTTVKTIPDGLKLQHINNFLGSQNKVTEIEYFDNTNIVSAENLIGYNSEDTFNRIILINNKDWPNVINAKGMFQNAIFALPSGNYYSFNLPKAIDCSYLRYYKNQSGNITQELIIAPNAENLDYAYYNNLVKNKDTVYDYSKCKTAKYMFASNSIDNSYIVFLYIDNIILDNVIDATGFVSGTSGLGLTYTSDNKEFLSNVEIIDYFYANIKNLQCRPIRFVSTKIKSAKGLFKNTTFAYGPDLHLADLINFTNLETFDGAFYGYSYGEGYTDSHHFIIDISASTKKVTVKDCFSNITKVKGVTRNYPMYFSFKGTNQVDYTDFMRNSDGVIFFSGTLNAETNIEIGSCFIRAFYGSTLTRTFLETWHYAELPIKNLYANINYFDCFNNCKILSSMPLACQGIPKSTYNIFKNASFAYKDNIEYSKFPNVNLNFNVGIINSDGNETGIGTQELFDCQISDNTTDFGFGEDYIGYKDFTIEEQFNYKEIKAQTINICLFRKIIAYGVDTTNHNNYIINNNTFINENNIIFNLKSCPPNDVEDWQIPEDKQNEDNPHYNYEHFYIKSTSMKNLTLRGNINLYREQTVYNFIVECSGLVNFDLQWDKNGSWRDRVTINNDILEGFLLRHYNGTMYIYSTKINIDNLKQSIDWWIEDNNRLNDLSIKQSVYNQLDSDYQSKLISRCSTLNLIQ